jgi:catechol 2,3-dioxygenase-like lactoylglutathione lyase family enzyme
MTDANAAKLCAAATTFAVADVLRSLAYYRDALGFAVAFTYGEPTYYAGLKRDEVTIHLQAASVAKRVAGQGSVYVFVIGVDALYAEFKARGARLLSEPRDYPYGMRDFNVADLDGNELCFGMETQA